MKKDGVAFLLQAIPWLILFAIWALLSMVSILVVRFPLSLAKAVLGLLIQGHDMIGAAVLNLLLRVRPVPSQDTPRPQHPIEVTP